MSDNPSLQTNLLGMRLGTDRPVMQGPLVLLTGATATGKSELAIRLAERVGGEIITVDSMQVYRGMDIGTAKPTGADRTRARHHLMDVCDVTHPFDAAQFVEQATLALHGIRARKRVPILCGGTGLYFKAFMEGLGDAPGSDPGLRTQLLQVGLEPLLSELKEKDPVTYQRIDRANLRRVIRAIQVIRLTGRPYSEQRADWRASSDRQPPAKGVLQVCLSRSPGDLQQRIETRVDRMFEEGLIEETQGLLDAGLAQNPIAMQALGYRQVVEHIQGVRGLVETVKLVKTKTRQFAKRQMTWFRRQLAFENLPVDSETPWNDLVERFADQLKCHAFHP